jgi:hypothetical protein
MLMRPDNGAIHIMGVPIELASPVGLLLHRRKEAGPDACLAPAIKTAGDSTPGAVPLRQVTPGDPCAQGQRIPLRMRRWSAAGRPVLGFCGGSKGCNRSH